MSKELQGSTNAAAARPAGVFVRYRCGTEEGSGKKDWERETGLKEM